MYSVSQLLLLDRVYHEPAEGAASDIVYVYPETEYYHKHCQWSWTWSVPGKAVGKGELEPRRVVMLLTMQAAAAARYVCLMIGCGGSQPRPSAEMDKALGNALE